MSETLALTRDRLRPHAGLVRGYRHLLALELDGRSVGEIYELIFSRLLKPDPFRLFAGAGQIMLGTDQRDRLVPWLAAGLAALPSGATVLDLGSGDGQTTGLALEGRGEPLAIVPLDPVAAYLERYRALFAGKLPRVSIPRVVHARFDELTGDGGSRASELPDSVEAILIVHSLFFASDLSAFLGLALDRLVPGGRIYLSHVEGLGRFAGNLYEGYLERLGAGQELADWRDRRDALDRLFGLDGETASKTTAQAAWEAVAGRSDLRVLEVERQKTRNYGHDFGDILAGAFLGGLAEAGDRDVARQVSFVAERLLESPESFDLRLHLEGPRARMLSVAQPQVLLAVEKL